MKKALALLLALFFVLICGCKQNMPSVKEEAFMPEKVGAQIASKLTETAINEEDAVLEEEFDEVKKVNTIEVSFKERDEKVILNSETGALIRYESGSIASKGNPLYTQDKTDEVLRIAEDFYRKLPVPQDYEISEWKMDFGGPDWQVDFTKKYVVDGYDKDIFNYGENVRLRISGADGSLLSANVFCTPVELRNTDKDAVDKEDAILFSELDKSKITKSYITCYKQEGKKTSRLCWCIEADYSIEGGVCDTRWVYVDLYTGGVIGKESCG